MAGVPEQLSELAQRISAASPTSNRAMLAQLDRLTLDLASGDHARQENADRTLQGMGFEIARPLMMFATGDPTRTIAVRQFLCRMGPPAVEQFVRTGYDMGLTCRGPAVFPEMIAAWKKYPESAAPFATFLYFGKVSTPFLIPLLRDPDSRIRNWAVQVLEKTGDPAAADAMLEALKSDDNWVRDDAAWYMVAKRDPRAGDEFVRLLEGRGHMTLQEAGAAGLASVYEPRFLPVLVKAAKWDGNASVRAAAASALASTKSPDLVRLSRRYRSLSTDPASGLALASASGILFYATAGACFAVAGFRRRAVRSAGPKSFGARAWLAASIAIGLIWGWLIGGVTGYQELAILFLALPGSALVLGLFKRPKEVAPSQWTVAIARSPAFSVLAFYGGYGLGQTALWGGSLLWMRLLLPL